MSILVFIEHAEGVIKKSSLEAVSYAAAMGDEVIGLVVGNVDESALKAIGESGASKVLHVTDDKLEKGIIQAYANVIGQAMEKSEANVLVLAQSSLGDPVAARVAAKIGAGFVSNITDLPDTTNGFKVRRSIYTGKAFANVEIKTDKKILGLRKNAVEAKSDGSEAAVEKFEVTLSDDDFKVNITSQDKATGDILLPEAELVVSGGRGLKGPENWEMIENLAKTLGAATGCSKPVSDMGWRPHHEHVGQTGVKVSPQLYIAIGISGAIQHLAGVNSSKNIVVINKDADAPFFGAADYGIVGDAFEVVPKLTEALKAAKN